MQDVIKVETPCYELASLDIRVRNISNSQGGRFKVRLMESNSFDHGARSKGNAMFKAIKKHEKVKKKKADRVPKNVKSKVDHGQGQGRKLKTEEMMHGVRETSATHVPKSEREDTMTDGPTATTKQSINQLLSAFYSPDSEVYLEPAGETHLTLHFLPFSIGNYYCSVVLSNDIIGDIVYAIDANSTLPLPDDLSFLNVSHGATVSSEDILEVRACHWLAAPGKELSGKLPVPLTNPARERALVMAGQLRLSETEFKRRSATQTLESATLAANALMILLEDKVSSNELNDLLSNTAPITFRVDQTDAQRFRIPKEVTTPGQRFGSKSTSAPKTIDLPVHFLSDTPGVFNCDILLGSSADYRLMRLSVSVAPEHQEAQLLFRSSVGQPIEQLIPIVNPTNFPWHLICDIQGQSFTGPSHLLVPALENAMYPLGFNPTRPGDCFGELRLRSSDPSMGVDMHFNLQGTGEDPPANDLVIIDCQANELIEHTVVVSNPTIRKLTFKVSCDIDCIVGPSILSVLPGHARNYTISCRPLKRGIVKGALVFEARSDVLLPTYDSDGDEIPDPYAKEAIEYDGFRLWYDVKLRVSPPLPVQHLEITAFCLQSSVLEIAIKNPTSELLKLEATIDGDHHLSGAKSIEIDSNQSGVYEVTYRPRRVGQSRGTVTFFNQLCGEFWYDLSLTSITPPSRDLEPLVCQLGRWASQTITLENPISEPIAFTTRLTNIQNFRLDLDTSRPLIVKPKKTAEITLTFTPSALGLGEDNQHCTITFSCQQFGDIVYHAVGGGVLPEVQDPVLLIAEVGAAATVNIPWRNPFNVAVNLDISLVGKSVFSLLF